MDDQDSRLLGLTAESLSGVDLRLNSFHGHEELSRLFSFDLEITSKKKDITPAQIVGKKVTFRIEQPKPNTPFRHFNGYVSRFYAGDEGNGIRDYRARVVPWLWFLTRGSDCRIFQDMSVPDIIADVFKKLGFKDGPDADFDGSKIGKTHPKREYCVQYRETNFNFVSRLMEEEGIFYYFTHKDKQHTLVLADKPDAYGTCEEKTVDFPLDSAGSLAQKDHVTSWEHRYEFRTGKWTQIDYNFKTPDKLPQYRAVIDKEIVALPDASKFEFYDYPGELFTSENAELFTKLRMEEEEADYDVAHGSSLCRSFFAGGKFSFGQHHTKPEEGQQYLITSIQHSARETQPYETVSGGQSTGGGYHNSFTCIPSKVKFTPARLTPKPAVQGVQTAIVVGPKEDEIYCDKYGRVKVQFHWDREGKKDANSSCWIRAANSVAGKQWGFMALPRIGQEVVVDFLEGDPDRPLIIGSVYNETQSPHYNLDPKKGDVLKTRSYIKTNSTKGGEGHNELMFDDLKDKEQVYIHAQKNMDVRVRADSKERIYGNRHQIIGWEKDGDKGGSQSELVYQNKDLHVQGAHTEHIEKDMQLLVGHGEKDEGGNLDVVVAKDKAELIEGDEHHQVKGSQNAKVDGTVSLTAGMDQHSKIGQNYALESGQTIHIKAGMTLVIEAGMQLSLKVGGNFIDISPAGVAIQGTLVMINSGGAAGSGAGAKPKAPKAAKQAKPKKPEMAMESKTGLKSAPG